MKSLLLLLVLFPVQSRAGDSTIELLRDKDQALLDAVASGDHKAWEAALAADAVYVDENGVIMNRADFMKQPQPLPPGASGTIRIASYSANVDEEVAIVIHTDDEQENYHGQILHARYLMTEAWRRKAGEWKLYLVHAYAILKDLPSITLPARDLQEYAGHYFGGSDLAYVIQWDGKQLVGGRAGRSPTPLQVEVRDVLYVPGQPRTRKIFQRDANGKVIGFVDRREGEDVVWKREAAEVR